MDYRHQLRDFIITELLDGTNPGSLADDQDLLISGLVDSLGVVRMINFIEHTLDIAVPPEDVTLENFQSVDKIATYLHRRNPEQQA